MAWRLHLANQAVQHLDILDGDPDQPDKRPLLAVWPRRDHIIYYDLNDGTPIDELTLHPVGVDDRGGAGWQTFINEMVAPNGAHLPRVRLDTLSAHLTDDGRMRLYDLGYGALALDDNGEEIVLDTDGAEQLSAVALDRLLGLSAALDERGILHVFQQNIRVGGFDLGLNLQTDSPIHRGGHVAIGRGGSAIYVSDGGCIIRTDSSGSINQRVTTHYHIRQMCCSPDGRYVMTNDIDNGVIRVYDGGDLTPTHQRFAIDLLAHAPQVQLLADLPPTFVAPSTLACNDAGVLAFSMAGVICVSHINQMDELPRPQALL